MVQSESANSDGSGTILSTHSSLDSGSGRRRAQWMPQSKESVRGWSSLRKSLRLTEHKPEGAAASNKEQ